MSSTHAENKCSITETRGGILMNETKVNYDNNGDEAISVD